ARLAGRIERFQQEAGERLQIEVRRIEAYYRARAEELLDPLRGLFRRIAAERARADLARSWRTHPDGDLRVVALHQEMRALEASYREELETRTVEKERRLNEVREKYAVCVELELTHAADVMDPRAAWTIRIAQNHAERETTLLYDVLRRRF